jgi:hypothetical protein
VDLHSCMVTVSDIGESEIETFQIAWANEILVCCRMEGESGLGKRQEEETVVHQSVVLLQQGSRRIPESAGGSYALRSVVLRLVWLTDKDSC